MAGSFSTVGSTLRKGTISSTIVMISMRQLFTTLTISTRLSFKNILFSMSFINLGKKMFILLIINSLNNKIRRQKAKSV